jgi:hypothetical protein
MDQLVEHGGFPRIQMAIGYEHGFQRVSPERAQGDTEETQQAGGESD